MIWNPWGLFGLVVLLVCTAMAIFIFTARPDRVQNRRLALLVFTEGLITAASPAGAAFAGSDATAGLFFIIHSAALVLVLPVMCRFLRTIDAPLAKPLTTRAGRMIPWLIAAAEGALFVARPGLFIAGFSKPWWGGRTFEVRPAMNAAYAFSGLVSIFSLLVAISGYRHAAPGTMAQDRARRYAIAFGFNDALTMIVTTIVPGVYGATHGGDLHPIEFVFVWAIPIVETIWVLLMTYGILRTQLFDIDLHLATGVRRGAIAAIVLFAFFAAAEIAKTDLSQDFGYIVGALA